MFLWAGKIQLSMLWFWTEKYRRQAKTEFLLIVSLDLFPLPSRALPAKDISVAKPPLALKAKIWQPVYKSTLLRMCGLYIRLNNLFLQSDPQKEHHPAHLTEDTQPWFPEHGTRWPFQFLLLLLPSSPWHKFAWCVKPRSKITLALYRQWEIRTFSRKKAQN